MSQQAMDRENFDFVAFGHLGNAPVYQIGVTGGEADPEDQAAANASRDHLIDTCRISLQPGRRVEAYQVMYEMDEEGNVTHMSGSPLGATPA